MRMRQQYESAVKHVKENNIKPIQVMLNDKQKSKITKCCNTIPLYYTGPLVEQFLECPVCKLCFGTWFTNIDYCIENWNYNLYEINKLLPELLERFNDNATKERLNKLRNNRRQPYQND